MGRKLKAYPSLDSAVRNITALYHEASPADVADGLVWYQTASHFAQGVADDTGLPHEVVCHVIAVLSPNVYWDRNKADAEAVCWEFVKTGKVEKTVVSTYGANLNKARAILETWSAGDDWTTIARGPKVTAFAANLVNPRDPFQVTLDTHAIAIAMGLHFTVSTVPNPRPDVKERYRRAYRLVARELDLVPCQVQAVCWIAWRKRHYNLHENTAKLQGEEI